MSDSDRPVKDVFISYVREERSRVARLSDALRQLGLTVWFDAALEPGTMFDEEIGREIYAARAVLVCWSKASVKSRWVRSEAMVAANRSVYAPVFLEDCELLPPFNIDHVEDLSGWIGQDSHDGWRKVLYRLGALVGRGEALGSWVAARSDDNLEGYRRFVKSFPTDSLVIHAKEKVWAIELKSLQDRLTGELGIPPPLDPSAEEVERLRERLELAQRRVRDAERFVEECQKQTEEYQRVAEEAKSQRALAEHLRQSAEARAEDAEARLAAGGPRIDVAKEPQETSSPKNIRETFATATSTRSPTKKEGLTSSELASAEASSQIATSTPIPVTASESNLNDVTRPDTRPCPLCGKTIKRRATRCGFCWMRVEPE